MSGLKERLSREDVRDHRRDVSGGVGAGTP